MTRNECVHFKLLYIHACICARMCTCACARTCELVRVCVHV